MADGRFKMKRNDCGTCGLPIQDCKCNVGLYPTILAHPEPALLGTKPLPEPMYGKGGQNCGICGWPVTQCQCEGAFHRSMDGRLMRKSESDVGNLSGSDRDMGFPLRIPEN